MDCLTFLGLCPQNGFSSIMFDERYDAMGPIYDTKTVFINQSRIAYQLTEDIYFLIDYKSGFQLIFFRNMRPKDAKKYVEKLCDNKIMYKVYNGCCDHYTKLKFINNKNKVSTNIENILDNIVSKILKHKNLTINVVLHGSPGTGKSSCIETMANKLGSNVYILPIDENLKDAIFQLGDVTKSIILIPELDKFLLNKDEDFAEHEQLLLEFLSGCYTTRNNIVAITCNDIKVIKQHAIMTRPGRVHFMIEFGNIDKKIIRDTVLEYFPDFEGFSVFDKFIGKVTIAEFKTAIINNYVMDKPIDSSFTVERIEYNNSHNNLYL